MKRNEKFIRWLEKDAVLPKTLRVISGYDVENLNRAENLMLKLLPHNSFQSYLFVDYVSARALMFSHFFIKLYLRLSIYLVAFYLIALSYFLFAHHTLYSLLFIGLGMFYIFWYYKKLYTVYKEHARIVNDARKNIKLKLFSSYILTLFQQFLQSAENKLNFIVNEYLYEFEKQVSEKINSLYKTFEKKIEELENKIQSLIFTTIESKPIKKRINYNSSKKVLLFHFVKFYSKCPDSIDLGRSHLNEENLLKLSAEANCTIQTIQNNLQIFKNKQTLLSLNSDQLKMLLPFLESFTKLDDYKQNLSFKSTVDSLQLDIERQIRKKEVLKQKYNQ